MRVGPIGLGGAHLGRVEGERFDERQAVATVHRALELGVNLIHVMPIMRCPEGSSDGGYAVSDFRRVDPRVGTNEDLRRLADSLHERDMLLALDERWPGIRDRVRDSRPSIRKHINIFVNGKRATLDTPLNGGSKVYVLTAMSGG